MSHVRLLGWSIAGVALTLACATPIEGPDGGMGGSGGTGSGGELSSSGGAPSGGSPGSGGGLVGATGGTTATGGAPSGGSTATGGATATGGTSATGGATSTGGSTGTGGSASGCQTLAFNTDSGSFGTTGAKCFTLAQGAQYGWQVSNGDGRTITINGVSLAMTGSGTFPAGAGSPPYTVEFSAGSKDYTSWSYY